jgi:hypothetical protein
MIISKVINSQKVNITTVFFRNIRNVGVFRISLLLYIIYIYIYIYIIVVARVCRGNFLVIKSVIIR